MFRLGAFINKNESCRDMFYQYQFHLYATSQATRPYTKEAIIQAGWQATLKKSSRKVGRACYG